MNSYHGIIQYQVMKHIIFLEGGGRGGILNSADKKLHSVLTKTIRYIQNVAPIIALFLQSNFKKNTN